MTWKFNATNVDHRGRGNTDRRRKTHGGARQEENIETLIGNGNIDMRNLLGGVG